MPDPIQSDHDLLIRLDTKVDSLTGEIRQQNTNTSDKLKDHETRIRILEVAGEVSKGRQNGIEITWGRIAGILTAVALIIGALWWVADAFKK